MRIGILAADWAYESRLVRRDRQETMDQLAHSMERHGKTLTAVRGVLEDGGHQVRALSVGDRLLSNLRAASPDLVFDTYFGPARRQDQAHVASILEYAGIPSTGGDAACHFIGLSKPLSKRFFAAFDLPTPRFLVARDVAEAAAAFGDSGLRFPVIVKTSHEGEGIGLDEASVVGTRKALLQAVGRVTGTYLQPALVEEFMPGREFTVGVIDSAPPRVLPVLEIVLGDQPVYSFAAKTRATAGEICPARLADDEASRIGVLAVRAGRALGCRDFWRVDFRENDQGAPSILEVNTLPGLQPGYSDIVKMAEPAGMTYGDMVRAILDCAARRRAPPS